MGNFLSDDGHAGNAQRNQNINPPNPSVFSPKELEILGQIVKKMGDSNLSSYTSICKSPILAYFMWRNDAGRSIKKLEKVLGSMMKETSRECLRVVWELVTDCLSKEPLSLKDGKSIPPEIRRITSPLLGFCVLLLDAAKHCECEVETSPEGEQKRITHASIPASSSNKKTAGATEPRPVDIPTAEPKNVNVNSIPYFPVPSLPVPRSSTPPPPAATLNAAPEIDLITAGMMLADSVIAYRKSKTAMPMFPPTDPPPAQKVGNTNSDDDPHSQYQSVTFDLVFSWVTDTAASASSVFATLLQQSIFKSSSSTGSQCFRPPKIRNGEKSTMVTQLPLISLALYSETLQGSWNLLYTTTRDGVDFNRIAYMILGYSGPTVFTIKTQKDESNNLPNPVVFGFFCNVRWRDSPKFYGSSRNFLFSLSPNIKIFRSKSGGNGNYQYLNTKSFGLPHGIGLGGTTDKFRLFIHDTVTRGECSSSYCLTFENGKVLPGAIVEQFDIDTLEIWGVGGEIVIQKALKLREKDRDDKAAAVRKAQQCDKAQFFMNEFDREFFLAGQFEHRQQADGRGECLFDDC